MRSSTRLLPRVKSGFAAGSRLISHGCSPPTLPPQSLYQAHLAPSLKPYSADLARKQEIAQEANIELLARVQQQRKEIEALVRGVETVVRDLNGCVEALRTGIDEEELRGIVRGVEEGMS